MNSYICYWTFCEDSGIKKPLSQYEFQKAIALAWLDCSKYWPEQYNKQNKRKRKRDNNFINVVRAPKKKMMSRICRSLSGLDSSTAASVSSASTSRSSRITDQSLDPRTGALRKRLSTGQGLHMPGKSSNDAKCGMCHWAVKKRTKANVLRCTTCNISLCCDCFLRFHTKVEVDDLRESFDSATSDTLASSPSRDTPC